jgi:hypothetical protein
VKGSVPADWARELRKIAMTLKWRRRVHHHATWPLLTIALLSACGGGGLLAVLQIITPLGGVWRVAPVSKEEMQFNNGVDSSLFTSQLNVTATITTANDVCDGGFDPAGTDVDVEGTLDNGDLVLHLPGNANTCLQGTFTDLITLEAGPPGPGLGTQSYINDRVAVEMDKGLWVSTGGAQLKLKFTEPGSVDNDGFSSVIGCVVSPPDQFNSNDINNPSSEMDGFNTATRAKPTVPEIKSILTGLTLFTQVVFQDGGTLKLLDSNGDSVTLHREEDTTTTCP